jgi:hypothetical protein
MTHRIVVSAMEPMHSGAAVTGEARHRLVSFAFDLLHLVARICGEPPSICGRCFTEALTIDRRPQLQVGPVKYMLSVYSSGAETIGGKGI